MAKNSVRYNNTVLTIISVLIFFFFLTGTGIGDAAITAPGVSIVPV